MKLKLLSRRLSISAPRVTVRRHVPWPLRVAGLAAVLVVFGMVVLATYNAGRSFAGFGRDLHAENASLREQVEALTQERDALVAQAHTAESRLSFERGAQEQLGRQVRSLELENAKLKDDVAFFETLSSSQPAQGIAIKRLQVEPDVVPNQIHYRVLISQGSAGSHDFSGELMLIVALQRQGKAAIINSSEASAGIDPKALQLNFRFFKRVEGTFRVPDGAIVKSVEARVLEHGVVRAQQTVMVN